MQDANKAFLGIGWSFPPEFHKQSDSLGIKMVEEEEDIRESLHILLSTRPGERVMHPTYGCGLQSLVFENINQSAITLIKDVIERAILFFEPRITLELVEVDTEHAFDGLLRLQINYTVRKTNNRSNIVYPFYFIEGSRVSV